MGHIQTCIRSHDDRDEICRLVSGYMKAKHLPLSYQAPVLVSTEEEGKKLNMLKDLNKTLTTLPLQS